MVGGGTGHHDATEPGVSAALEGERDRDGYDLTEWRQRYESENVMSGVPATAAAPERAESAVRAPGVGSPAPGADVGRGGRPVPAARAAAHRLVSELAGEGWLDELMAASSGEGGVELTG